MKGVKRQKSHHSFKDDCYPLNNSDRWLETQGKMIDPRTGYEALKTGQSEWLFAGGRFNDTTFLSTSEVYDATTSEFIESYFELPQPSLGHCIVKVRFYMTGSEK